MLSSNYVITDNYGTRVSSRGRLSGGYVMGIHSRVVHRTSVLAQLDDYCLVRVNNKDGHIILCFVYFSPKCSVDFLGILQHIKAYGNNFFIIGDMNARIGSFQNADCSDGSGYQRDTKDEHVNTRGRNLIKCLKGTDLKVMNGSTVSDKCGSYTFINSNGSSVIDLCIATNSVFHSSDFKVLDMVHSCHFPVHLSYYKKPVSEEKRIHKLRWNHNLSEAFVKDLDKHEELFGYPKSILEYIDNLRESCRKVGMIRNSKVNNTQVGGPKWFDKKCLAYKLMTQKCLCKYRKSNVSNKSRHREEYLGARRTYKNLCKAKRTKFYKTLERNLCNTKNSQEFYSAINYYRPRQIKTSNHEYVNPEQFRDFYATLFSDNTPTTDEQNDKVIECKE